MDVFVADDSPAVRDSVSEVLAGDGLTYRCWCGASPLPDALAFPQRDGSEGGLALHITQRLVNRLRGSIALRNLSGGGARFSLFLPVAAEPALERDAV
ncbi:MAG: ATP-binding protein [Candidatus Lambdaproteobacteria bacterium]|nr:ATP-binding protein [Candidatus Lambdaproteobacteria bacterium]